MIKEIFIYVITSIAIYRLAYSYIRYIDNKERKKLNDKEYQYYVKMIELEKELKKLKKEKIKDDSNNNTIIN
ncbi:MAG: hypothetical protein SOZ95_07100 [Bacilli bacterium]|nr:hypothetical protein [Bacilli bacterium]